MGDINDDKPVLARIHSELNRRRLQLKMWLVASNWRPHYAKSAKQDEEYWFIIVKKGGIGLINKIRAYALVRSRIRYDWGEPCFRFCCWWTQLFGLCRYFWITGVKQVRLLTNNPNKIETMKMRYQYCRAVPLNVGENRYNTEYLDTKAKKWDTLLCIMWPHLITCPHCQEEIPKIIFIGYIPQPIFLTKLSNNLFFYLIFLT